VSWFGAVCGLLVATASGLVLVAMTGSMLVAPGALLLGGGAYFAIGRRDARRRALAKRSLPEPLRSALERHVAFYRGLADGDRARFEREVAWFLDEQRISTPEGKPVEEDTRALIAASAIMLTFGVPGYRWPRQRDIVVMQGPVAETPAGSEPGSVIGMVHSQGPILLSSKALRHGFKDVDDGQNVGLHELAHVLDFEVGTADGVSSLLPWRSVEPWIGLVHREIAKVKKKRSLLRKYASTNDAEFFAVATEAFFERPRALRARHPELYALLTETYGQDPAARADERGSPARR